MWVFFVVMLCFYLLRRRHKSVQFSVLFFFLYTLFNFRWRKQNWVKKKIIIISLAVEIVVIADVLKVASGLSSSGSRCSAI